MINVGSAAPEFKLFNQNKQEVALSSLRGKNVVLVFYPGAFTSVCESEMCSFRDHLANFNSMNATVVGISPDSPFANMGFASKNNFTFDLLSDYTRATIKAYGIVLENFAALPGYTSSQRAVFVLDKEGIVRWTWVGETPKNLPDYEAVKKAVSVLK
jgi:glutaredoxin-dependent peroxiredoxin